MSNVTSVNLGFEDKLCKMPNNMRGHVDASKYRQMVPSFGIAMQTADRRHGGSA